MKNHRQLFFQTEYQQQNESLEQRASTSVKELSWSQTTTTPDICLKVLSAVK